MSVLGWAEPRRTKTARSWRERRQALTAPLRRNLYKQRDLILRQALAMQGLMRLLMKPRNTGQPWTARENHRIRRHLRILALSVPTLFIFLLPGGLLLLPILVEILDRRRTNRK